MVTTSLKRRRSHHHRHNHAHHAQQAVFTIIREKGPIAQKQLLEMLGGRSAYLMQPFS